MKNLEALEEIDEVVIFGGGRWAKTIAVCARDLLDEKTELTLCSPRGALDLRHWAVDNDLLDKFNIVKDWRGRSADKRNAAIVANASPDHLATALAALQTPRLSLLVEKPFATSVADARKIINAAQASGSRVFAAHVFRFAQYLENFSELLPHPENLSDIKIEWADPAEEFRHGEVKRHDPRVPIFVDVLPHIMSLLVVMIGAKPVSLISSKVDESGLKAAIVISASGIKCLINMDRNSSERVRRVLVQSYDGGFELDFASEPGWITNNGVRRCADLAWEHNLRPLSAMLLQFFKATATEIVVDPRLEVSQAISSCILAEKVANQHIQ